MDFTDFTAIRPARSLSLLHRLTNGKHEQLDLRLDYNVSRRQVASRKTALSVRNLPRGTSKREERRAQANFREFFSEGSLLSFSLRPVYSSLFSWYVNSWSSCIPMLAPTAARNKNLVKNFSVKRAIKIPSRSSSKPKAHQSSFPHAHPVYSSHSSWHLSSWSRQV